MGHDPCPAITLDDLDELLNPHQSFPLKNKDDNNSTCLLGLLRRLNMSPCTGLMRAWQGLLKHRLIAVALAVGKRTFLPLDSELLERMNQILLISPDSSGPTPSVLLSSNVPTSWSFLFLEITSSFILPLCTPEV